MAEVMKKFINTHYHSPRVKIKIKKEKECAFMYIYMYLYLVVHIFILAFLSFHVLDPLLVLHPSNHLLGR